MHRRLSIAAIFCLLAGIAHASPLSPTAPSAGEQCRAGIAAAERGHGIPPQLLAAIGRVESGRRDPVSGIWGAWPWTINAEGSGAYFDTKAAAVQAVMALQARGVRSIDVGCMQVNLMHHPTAFTTLDMAFEPAVNAEYAARFLVQLHEQTGDWTTATADYHSSNPWEGGPYADHVTAIWPEEQRKAGLQPSMPVAPVQNSTFASGAFGQVSRNAPPVLAHQTARLFAMAGMPPVMMPPGTAPLGFMQIAPGQAPRGGQIAAGGPGLRAAAPGRGLDFYRAMPIQANMAMRPVIRTPFGGSLK